MKSRQAASSASSSADGRFIVIGEGSPDWLGKGYPALLFSGDPVERAQSIAFGFVAPEGYRATDMAALPKLLGL